jgi:hypothetical protein
MAVDSQLVFCLLACVLLVCSGEWLHLEPDLVLQVRVGVR